MSVKMNTRRRFIKTIGSGVAISAIAPSVVASSFSANKNIRIGIIGAENSHSYGYGKLFNIEKKFPGVEVKYIWGETDEFAKRSMKLGNIPNQVKDQREMLGKIDALIVDHRHAKYHLEAALPFVKAGIPTFIDKPFCYRADEGKEFLELAKKLRTPVSSYSSIAHSYGTLDLKKQISELHNVKQIVRTGTIDLDSEYGGFFFYGVHLVQPLLDMVDDVVERVKVTRIGSHGSANIVFKSGLYANLVFKQVAYGWETFVESKEGFAQLKPTIEEPDPGINYVDMVEMFKTGKEPRSHQRILDSVSDLEALEKSAETEMWTEVNYLKLSY
jgi:predicted dehydrogenase